MNAQRREGQVLVLFALVLVVLVGISALVVDIGLKYSTERRYQAIADAAALAGAQQLQPATRAAAVSADQQDRARRAALRAIVSELAPSLSVSCIDWAHCAIGTDYTVSIITPSPNCVDCEPDRAIQVNITEPNHSTGFARVLGQSSWRLSRTSVAGLSFGKSYAIVALRPPQPLGGSSGFDVRDIRIDGNYTTVKVTTGDVGSNSNMEYGGTGAILELDPGYRMYYFDPYHDPEWTPPSPADPAGSKIGALIEDPGYPIPAHPAQEWTMRTGEDTTTTCTDAVAVISAHAGYMPYVPTDPARIHCYRPGTYLDRVTDRNGELTVLEPGLYYFSQGLDIQSSIVGGYAPGEPGVALLFPADQLFKQRNGMVALNAGTRFAASGGDEAAAAVAPSGIRVQTSTDTPIKMTVIVERDSRCVVQDPFPEACTSVVDNGHHAIDIAGGAAVYLAGVQYAPSDNTSLSGGSAGVGYVGQVWAWTLKYTGGTLINQEGSVAMSPGTIRIDTACSPGQPQADCD